MLLATAAIMLAAGVALIVHWALRPRPNAHAREPGNNHESGPLAAVPMTGPGLCPETVRRDQPGTSQ